MPCSPVLATNLLVDRSGVGDASPTATPTSLADLLDVTGAALVPAPFASGRRGLHIQVPTKPV